MISTQSHFLSSRFLFLFIRYFVIFSYIKKKNKNRIKSTKETAKWPKKLNELRGKIWENFGDRQKAPAPARKIAGDFWRGVLRNLLSHIERYFNLIGIFIFFMGV